MSRHDSQPPMPDWQPEARPCADFERPDRKCPDSAGCGTGALTERLSIPPNIVLGQE